jgi:hypothetical protein
MISTKLLFCGISYLLLFGLSFIPNLWIFFGEPTFVRWTSIIFFVVHFLFILKFNIIYPKIQSFLGSKYTSITFFILGIIFFITFPIRNLSLGDGILLIENIILETLAFQYSVVPDELLEGFSHSILFRFLLPFTYNPMIAYRILSTFIGVLLLSIFSRIYFKYINLSIIYLLFFSSGGSLLYYGYTENYVLVSFFIFLTLLYGYKTISEESSNTKQILIIAFLGALGAITHLISGFIIFALVYYCFCISNPNINNIFSEKILNLFNKQLFKNIILAGITASLVIVPLYIYFIYFSDLQIDLSLAHASHPPFLPLKKIFSIGHLKDLGLEATLVAYTSILSIIYFYLFQKDEFKINLQEKKFQFLWLSFLGFFLHFITYNPLLGYPADWDLMGFIWIPLFLMNVHLLTNNSKPYMELLPLYFFSWILLVSTAHNLSKKNQEEEKIQFLVESIREYLPTFKKIEPTLLAKHKKTYIHTDYFLFRTHQKLKSMDDPTLLGESEALVSEFKKENLLVDKEKWKKFIQRATEFHVKYLQKTEQQ